MQYLNTHYYDGKIIKSVEKVPDVNEKVELFDQLISKIQNNPVTQKFRAMAIVAVNAIKRDIQKQANYDPTNDMWADDILYWVCKYVEENNDLLKLLSEQLHDIIVSGQCAQGRCTRLFQVLVIRDT